MWAEGFVSNLLGLCLIFHGESDGAKIFCAKCNVCKKKFANFLHALWHKNAFSKSCSKLEKNETFETQNPLFLTFWDQKLLSFVENMLLK